MINIAMCGLIVDVDWLLESAERIKVILLRRNGISNIFLRTLLKQRNQRKGPLPEMNEISKPLLSVGVRVSLVCGHVEGALAEEGLGVGRHVREVVHHHEHLHHRPQRVEQRQLDRAAVRDTVALLPEVDMALR